MQLASFMIFRDLSYSQEPLCFCLLWLNYWSDYGRKQKNRPGLYKPLLLVTFFLSLNLYFKVAKETDTVNIAEFPKAIGTWSSVDLPISAEDLSMLETKNAFVRKYTNKIDGGEVYLFLVYSQHNRKVAHPPEICYLGSGVTITENIRDIAALVQFALLG